MLLDKVYHRFSISPRLCPVPIPSLCPPFLYQTLQLGARLPSSSPPPPPPSRTPLRALRFRRAKHMSSHAASAASFRLACLARSASAAESGTGDADGAADPPPTRQDEGSRKEIIFWLSDLAIAEKVAFFGRALRSRKARLLFAYAGIVDFQQSCCSSC